MTGPLRAIAVLVAVTGDALLNTLAGSRRHRRAPSTPPASQLVVFEIIGRECVDRTIGQRDIVNGDIAHRGIDDQDREIWGYHTTVD